MKTKMLSVSFAIGFLLMLAAAPQKLHAANTPSASGNIYNESANGAKQISDALIIAKKEHKRVLLDIGANWCIWCRRLHTLFETNNTIATELKSGFVVVMIDMNEEHNKNIDARYGHPRRLGIPVILILDADGKRLTTQNSGPLEEGDHHSPEKVMAFLKEWAPKQSQ
jgi:thiol:disulfide interchange protein